jgi:hypothetical protein
MTLVISGEEKNTETAAHDNEGNKENILDVATREKDGVIMMNESSDQSKDFSVPVADEAKQSEEGGDDLTLNTGAEQGGDVSSSPDLKKKHEEKEGQGENERNRKSPVAVTGTPLKTKEQRQEQSSSSPSLYDDNKENKLTTENCNENSNKGENLLSCRDLNKNRSRNDEHGDLNYNDVPAELSKNNKTTERTANKEQHDISILKNISTTMIDPVVPKDTSSAFVEGGIENFWECSYCNMLPFPWRATGSVVFCNEKPTIDLVAKHLSVCQGKKPLRIPRNAAIKMKKAINGDSAGASSSILVSWNNGNYYSHLRSKSSRVKRQASTSLMESSIEKNVIAKRVKKHHSSKDNLLESDVKAGVDDDLLATPEDKKFTTEFAYFTVLQLKKCYLTKSGGSRASCPVGYPGLACGYCAGNPTERRFFYTSSDHLRNSFSHIPSHLMVCGSCPDEVKAKLEEYKSVRNKQKSQLKAGDHKIFIDRVWTKLHGEGGGAIIQVSENNVISPGNEEDEDIISSGDEMSSEEKNVFDIECNPNDDYICESLDGQFLESKEIAIETSSSAILSPTDKKLATSYVFYALLQMVPKQFSIDVNGNIRDFCYQMKCQSQPSSSIESLDKKTTSNALCMRTGSQSINVGVQSKVNLITSSLSNNENQNKENCIDTRSSTVDIDPNRRSAEKNDGQHIKIDHVLDTLVCKHCKNEDNSEQSFLPESAEDLYLCFHNITSHIFKCQKCPNDVKNKLQALKAFRPIQEAFLEKGAQKKLIDNVWKRVKKHFSDPDLPTESKATGKKQSTSKKGGGGPPSTTCTTHGTTYSKDVLNTQLLCDSDRSLVSDFTFYTMEQMEPCVLENSGNGSRSMFAFGFPGLGCKHCASQQNARKFFYRTPEILSGNYAHIPNHIFSCKHTPPDVKELLAEKKKTHQSQKQKLQRGSQRVFFNNIFDRLHLKMNRTTSSTAEHPVIQQNINDDIPTNSSSSSK